MFKRDEHQSNEIETVIGPSVKVEGDFIAAGNVVVEGTVSGNLKTDKFLKVGEGAKILADVSAGSAHIAGELRGNLVVTENLELTSTAKVFGDVKSKNMAVASGAIIHGTCAIGEHMAAANEDKSNKLEKLDKPSKIIRHKEWRVDDVMAKTKE